MRKGHVAVRGGTRMRQLGRRSITFWVEMHEYELLQEVVPHWEFPGQWAKRVVIGAARERLRLRDTSIQKAAAKTPRPRSAAKAPGKKVGGR